MPGISICWLTPRSPLLDIPATVARTYDGSRSVAEWRAARAGGEDRLELCGVGRAGADRGRLVGAVVVARPRGDQSEVGGETTQVRTIGLGVVGVVDLQPQQSGLGHDDDGVVADDPT